MRRSSATRLANLLFVAVITIFGSFGCSGKQVGDLPPLGTVSGVITLNDQPLANAFVTFVPVQNGRPSSAMTDSNGYYSLSYDATHRGAAVGRHLVSIKTEIAAEYNEGQLIPGTGINELVPAKYRSSSPLEVEVTAGDNRLDIPLQK